MESRGQFSPSQLTQSNPSLCYSIDCAVSVSLTDLPSDHRGRNTPQTWGFSKLHQGHSPIQNGRKSTPTPHPHHTALTTAAFSNLASSTPSPSSIPTPLEYFKANPRHYSVQQPHSLPPAVLIYNKERRFYPCLRKHTSTKHQSNPVLFL